MDNDGQMYGVMGIKVRWHRWVAMVEVLHSGQGNNHGDLEVGWEMVCCQVINIGS